MMILGILSGFLWGSMFFIWFLWWFSMFFLYFPIFCFQWLLAKKKPDISDVSAMFHGSMRFESKGVYDVSLVDFFVFGACSG